MDSEANWNLHTCCHPERAKRVEGSSHLFCAVQLVSAKILRLRATRYAQNDSVGGELAKFQFVELKTE